MKKTLNKIILTSISSLAILLNAGCRTKFIHEHYDKKQTSCGLGSELRIGWIPKSYNYDLKESKTIPVHPGDSSFLRGETSIKAEDRLTAGCFEAGYAGRFDVSSLTFKIGADSEICLDKYLRSYSNKQQSSDTRAKSNGSFVYDRIDPYLISMTPFIGAEFKLGKFEPYVEYGLPIKKFVRDWGHDRYGKEQSIGNESDSTTGKKITVGAYFRDMDLQDSRLGLAFSKEDYKTKFGGITDYSIILSTKWEF